MLLQLLDFKEVDNPVGWDKKLRESYENHGQAQQIYCKMQPINYLGVYRIGLKKDK